ncbi:MAG: Ankyrin repeat-containing protein, partial [Firmicutes bacterium]|nr:Ankyrin repeat-containing protein [Bacillota bacterium]
EAEAPLPLDKIVQQGITFEGKNLITYAGRGDEAIVLAFLDAGMDINTTRNTDGWTALTAASFYKKPEMVKLLLEKQAIVNVQDRSGKTPLMYAAAMGTEKITTLLLEAGANPNTQDKNGRTALMEAYSKQEAKIAEIGRCKEIISNSYS